MDRLLRLKLEMAYKDFPIEQARQAFEEIKNSAPPKSDVPVVKKRRKLRILVDKNPNE
jgi:hypothetical protein